MQYKIVLLTAAKPSSASPAHFHPAQAQIDISMEKNSSTTDPKSLSSMGFGSLFSLSAPWQ